MPGYYHELRKFPGRDNALRALTRYSLYRVMLYRTNLYTHSERVAALVRAINPTAESIFGTTYDPVKAELLGFVHDDAELIFGDIQAGNKSKMTPDQLKEVREAEHKAIGEIAQRFPERIAGYSYKTLLKDAADHTSIESQVMCYADKYDALGEALHEIYAGNRCFTTNVVNEYGHIPTPPEYYTEYFAHFPDKFPDLRPLLAVGLTLFRPVVLKDYDSIAKTHSPHGLESLTRPTGDTHYDEWRRIVLADTNDEVIRDLYVTKEHL
ncbi:MAG TPA: YfbR-like 5'-deoxynucleotidase [Candidatus Saccharimonadales bacterium]